MGVEAHRGTLFQALLDNIVQSRKRAATNKQDVVRIHGRHRRERIFLV